MFLSFCLSFRVGEGLGLQTSYTYGDTCTLVHVYIVCGARFLRSYSRCLAVVVIRAEFDSCDDQANAEGGCGKMVDERVVVVMVEWILQMFCFIAPIKLKPKWRRNVAINNPSGYRRENPICRG